MRLFAGRASIILIVSIAVIGLAFIFSLYAKNIQLAAEVGEFKAKAETFASNIINPKP